MALSKYKTLIVSGCSFTHNNHDGHCTWGNSLAYWYGMDIVNLAVPGAGNKHIANSIILYIEKNNLNYDEVLVMPMWSNFRRIDFITDRELSNFNSVISVPYKYDEYNELVNGGVWWHDKPRVHVEKVLVDYSKYQSNKSLALNSWLEINSLKNYLTVKGIDNYFTSYFDNSEFINELSEIGLNMDYGNWVTYPCLGDYAKEHGMVADDGFHPTIEGHETWAREVLVPFLTKKKVLWQTI